MRKLIAIVALLVFLVGCAPGDEPGVTVVITEKGIMANSEVRVENYYPGARAEMPYYIYNATDHEIKAHIYLVNYYNVSNYSKASDYRNAPNVINEWMEIPKTAALKAHETYKCTVALEIPDSVGVLPDKFGFLVGVTNSGDEQRKIQNAVATWWLVDMR